MIFERGEMRLVVNNIPARICPGCGEAYVEEDIAMQLLRDAEEMANKGMVDDIIDYVIVS